MTFGPVPTVVDQLWTDRERLKNNNIVNSILELSYIKKVGK